MISQSNSMPCGRRAPGVDGTINDAFVAAVAIGVADHHRSLGVALAQLRVSIPISTRADGDGVGGNHWTPGRVDVATTDLSPDTMMRVVRATIAQLRNEPGPRSSRLRRRRSFADFRPRPRPERSAPSWAVSTWRPPTVPGTPFPLHLCGQEVRALVPFGPLAGAAANITLLSHDVTAHIGITTDPAAVRDSPAFAQHLAAAFASVVKGS